MNKQRCNDFMVPSIGGMSFHPYSPGLAELLQDWNGSASSSVIQCDTFPIVHLYLEALVTEMPQVSLGHVRVREWNVTINKRW